MKSSLFFTSLLILLSFQPAARAGENLLSNPSALGGASDGWNIILDGANVDNGWRTNGQSVDGDGASFITSYSWCTRSQTIDLIAAGFEESFLDSSPPILARESFKGVANVADQYFLRVELRDAAGAVLDVWEVGTQASPLVANGNWREESHLFENYPAGVRQIYWEDGGKDAEFWLGHYGTLLDGAELSFVDPAPTEINLSPGTYPVGALAGEVAGVLSAEDNELATHTFALVSQTQQQNLVSAGANWAYLDDGSDPGAAWAEISFDDLAWSIGPAQLGYGDGDEATVIAGEGLHYTSYFRHRFDLSAGEQAAVQGLTLRVKRDDGVIVYLNGAEVVRDNMPAGVVTRDTPAAGNAGDDGALFIDFTIPANLLVAGENVVAAEVHQQNLTSSDVSFDLELIAEVEAQSFDNSLFTIAGDQLRFAQAAATVPVTIGANWTVNVRVTDEAGNTLDETLQVTGVPDPAVAPTGISLTPAATFEGLPAGTVVGELFASDADVGDFHLFDLVAGVGDVDNGLFEVQSNRLVTAVVLDDSQAARSVRVRATDRAGFAFEQSLSVDVRNVNNPPSAITFSGSTVEVRAAAGTLVGLLATEDADAGDSHQYAFVPTAGTETVFGFGQEWRFLDDGSDLGASNWTAPGAAFDDSAWKTGTGSFGYGDAQDTLVDYGPDDQNKHITTYFRRSFILDTPASYDEYVLGVMRDDGVAVYLNGNEIGRDGLAPAAAATDLATAVVGNADETTPIEFTVPNGLFVAGSNTLAVEVHQASAGSSDLTFDLSLSGAIDASGDRYFDIVNGNELRTGAAFPGLDLAVGSQLSVVVRSTDGAGDSVQASFAVTVVSDDPSDRDGDGLLDAWEELHFGDITTQDGDDDSDGDGQTDGDEFRFVTLPNDPRSRFDLQVERRVGGGYRLLWESDFNRIYTLQSTGFLSAGPWVDSATGPRLGTGGLMSEDVPETPGGERQFRLLVEIP